MKVCVFTSNQPRHISLIECLAEFAEEVFCFLEAGTLFPGQEEGNFRKSPLMQEYFSHVLRAEKMVFGSPRILPANARVLPMKMGDLNSLHPDVVSSAVKQANVVVVFGASYIRSPLAELLIEKKAFNIHMGVSPYFRGSSCNFWALYKNHPEDVGATIHLLTKGLDSGPMLFHCLPQPGKDVDGFSLGMLAVKAAHQGLTQRLKDNTLWAMEPVPQDKSLELCYTRMADFTDEVASNYLARQPSSEEISLKIKNRDPKRYIRPYFA